MPDLPPIPAEAWFISALFLGAAVYVFGHIARSLAQGGGQVRTSDFALSELLMSIVCASFFALLMLAALQRHGDDGKPLGIDAVLPSSLLFVAFTAGILGFLRYARRLNLVQLFGLDRLSPLTTLGWVCILILATFPIAGAANFLTMLALKEEFAPQPLVRLFSEVARQDDHLAVAKIFAAGVIIQPVCEEFLFRGFFYGVWKRYLGPLGAGFLSCLLFAAFHTSLPALAGLFVLAVCLTLAYERTGSLLVPVGMHALFNFTSLLFLYAQARFGLPS